MSDAPADRPPVERRPGRAGLAAVVLALVVGVGPLAGAPSASGLAAVAGGAVLAVGAALGRRFLVDIGFAGVVVGVLLAGVGGLPTAPLVVATVGGVVAWDAAGHAVGLGEQLGREAPTARAVLAHVASTALVCSGVAVLAFVAAEVSAGGRPVATLAALLAGAVLLVGALGR